MLLARSWLSVEAWFDLVEAEEPAYHWSGVWAGETPSERHRRRRAQPPSDQEEGLEEAIAIRVGRSP